MNQKNKNNKPQKITDNDIIEVIRAIAVELKEINQHLEKLAAPVDIESDCFRVR